MTAAKEEPEDMGLEWIQTRTEMYKIQPETFAQKGVRKFKENPFIPIGVLEEAFRADSNAFPFQDVWPL